MLTVGYVPPMMVVEGEATTVGEISSVITYIQAWCAEVKSKQWSKYSSSVNKTRYAESRLRFIVKNDIVCLT